MAFFQNRVSVRKILFQKGHFFKPIKYDVIRDFKMGMFYDFLPPPSKSLIDFDLFKVFQTLKNVHVSLDHLLYQLLLYMNAKKAL
jgi:hypothetical protein